MALIDSIKKTLAKPVQAPQAEDEQAGLEASVAAKTGKAAVSGAPRASRVGQRAGEALTAAQASQLTQQGEAVATGLGATQAAQAQQLATAQAQQAAQARTARAGIAADVGGAAAQRGARGVEHTARLTAREQQAAADINHRARETVQQLAADRGVAQADLFATFKQGTAELALRRDAAKLEQAAFQSAMANKAYVDNLLRTGQERRMQDEAGFRSETRRIVLGENLAITLANMQHKIDLDADATTFSKQMADMDIATAQAILAQQRKDAQVAMVSQGVQTVGAGVQKNPDAVKKLFASETPTVTQSPTAAPAPSSTKSGPSVGDR